MLHANTQHRRHLVHIRALHGPPETGSSNKDSESTHINTLPQSARNTEMVSTCHVNLLSTPAAFHMHYTPRALHFFSSPTQVFKCLPVILYLLLEGRPFFFFFNHSFKGDLNSDLAERERTFTLKTCDCLLNICNIPYSPLSPESGLQETSPGVQLPPIWALQRLTWPGRLRTSTRSCKVSVTCSW